LRGGGEDVVQLGRSVEKFEGESTLRGARRGRGDRERVPAVALTDLGLLKPDELVGSDA